MSETPKTLAVGDEVFTECGKCKSEMYHVITAMSGDKIRKVMCKGCNTTHLYKDKAEKAKKKSAAKKKAVAKKKPVNKTTSTKAALKGAKGGRVASNALAPAASSKEKKSSSSAKSPSPKNGSAARSPFIRKQHQKLLELRDALLDQMSGVARDTLRSRAEGSEASAFGMHQADAGSDSYDRDFALNLISQEQDALYEIEEALKRVEAGTYGVCEMSGEKIPVARLEALPFARFTVECQEQLEKQEFSGRYRSPVTSLFGLSDTDGDSSDSDDDDDK